jgi:hypothetical protein
MAFGNQRSHFKVNELERIVHVPFINGRHRCPGASAIDHLKRPHQLVVFVFKDVAVPDVADGVWVWVGGDDEDRPCIPPFAQKRAQDGAPAQLAIERRGAHSSRVRLE